MLKNKGFEKALSWILCFCTGLFLFMDMSCPAELVPYAGENAIVNIANNLFLSIKFDFFVVFVCFAACLWLQQRYPAERKNLLLRLVCLAVAAVWLLGKFFAMDNTLDELSKGPGQLVKALIYLLGSYNLLMLLWSCLDRFLDSDWDIKESRLMAFVGRHSFLSFFAAIIVCALPTWIVCYPGYMNSDAYCQVAYYFGIYEFVSHHPPVHTLFISLPIKLGMLLGSSNLGLYLLVCVQMLIFAAVFAYMLHTMVRLSSPRWLVVISFLTVVLSSCYIPVAAWADKDNLYSYGVLLFTIEVLQIFRMKDEYWKKPGHVALLALSILMVMLMRNNGKYLLYVLVPVLLVIFAYNGLKNGQLKKAAIRSMALLLPIVASVLIQNAVIAYYDVAPGSRREALSLPFQQTARLIYERGDSITEEERAIIDKVISYEDISTKYNPMISDPVKEHFRDDCSTSDLLAYAKVWLKQGIKAPHVYLKATLNQNYPLFSPWGKLAVYEGLTTESRLHYHISEPLGLHEVNVADSLEDVIDAAHEILVLLPVPGLTSNLAVCCIFLLLLCQQALRRRYYIFLLCSLPALLTIGTVILAPVMDVRYAFAVIYSIPVLTAVYLKHI